MPKSRVRRGRPRRQGVEDRPYIPVNPWTMAEGGKRGSGQIVTRRLSFSQTAATATFTDLGTANVGSCTEWSSMASLYGEYRVLAIRAKFTNASGSAGSGYFLVATYRQTPPAATQQALWAAERPMLFDAGSTQRQLPFYEVRVTGIGDTDWINVGNTASALAGMKLYNANSGTITIFVEMVVQFRARL